MEAMKANPRLFARVAPMGVNDIIMAVRYAHRQQPPLEAPITAFDGLLDATIERGNMVHWAAYTGAAFQLVPVRGDHYFVSTHYRQVCSVSHHGYICCMKHCRDRCRQCAGFERCNCTTVAQLLCAAVRHMGYALLWQLLAFLHGRWMV